MASTNETGHAKNVANLEVLIGYCTSYGPTYNPSKASIKLAALSTLHTNAQAALASLKTAKTAYDNATNARETSAAPVKKLCTKIVNALAATDASKLTVDDAKAINMKIQGRRVNGKTAAKQPEESAEPASENNISVSQQSFDNLIDNFAKLTQTLTAEPLYKPNEVELQVATLNTMLTDLKNKNKAVITATANLSNARIARDKILYAEGAGIHDAALSVKQYIKSLFGPTSPQYKQVRGIKFANIRS